MGEILRMLYVTCTNCLKGEFVSNQISIMLISVLAMYTKHTFLIYLSSILN